jgi:hypothetical protein
VIHGLRISYSMIIDINSRIASCDHADLFGWIFEVAVHFIIFTEYSYPHRSLSQ